MTAGLNIQARVHRMSVNADDDVGGALITGTVVYECLNTRLTPARPSFLLLAQGLETERLATATVRPGTLVIYERDEFEVVGPINHPSLGERWRVVSVDRPSLHPSDSRGFLNLTLNRIDRTRTQQ
jgi:hypothetical protein